MINEELDFLKSRIESLEESNAKALVEQVRLRDQFQEAYNLLEELHNSFAQGFNKHQLVMHKAMKFLGSYTRITLTTNEMIVKKP